MAVNQAAPAQAASLTVTSPDFAEGGHIPKAYATLGEGRSPPLAWNGAFHPVTSYAVIVQDPDAPTPKPFVHWLVFNIPGNSGSLQPGSLPYGSVVGHNSAGASTWFPLAPPPGAAHHYHFQVFALDQRLALTSGAGRGEVVDAMKGHVVASGELTALYKVGDP